MSIFVDFDYTLFNTTKMREALQRALAPWGVSPLVFNESEQRLCATKLYEPKQHLQLIAQSLEAKAGAKTNVDLAKMVAAYDETIADTSKFLYADSLDFLRRHQQEEVKILSFGNPEWQRRKILAANLQPLVSEIITIDQSKESLCQKWPRSPRSVFINDRGSEIDAIKKVRPDVFAVWIFRPQTPYHKESCLTTDAEVQNLQFSVVDLLRQTALLK